MNATEPVTTVRHTVTHRPAAGRVTEYFDDPDQADARTAELLTQGHRVETAEVTTVARVHLPAQRRPAGDGRG